jgi:tetratricopeptide (TPR) repeat protein
LVDITPFLPIRLSTSVRLRKLHQQQPKVAVAEVPQGRPLDLVVLAPKTTGATCRLLGGEGKPLPRWARPIIARGPRPSFELEECRPVKDAEDWESDPVDEAIEQWNAGQRVQAIRLLEAACRADLRCLDAHAHLGSFRFEHRPEQALLHYEVGAGIGRLSLGKDFDGVLPWGCLDNRPFLRCLHGYGLCLWRLGRFREAKGVFEQLLWMNPSDNQGVRFALPDVRAKRIWQDFVDEEEGRR